MTNKILIIGPSWVGDMVMAQSLFKLLKSRADNPQIDVLAPEWSMPVLERMPEISRAIKLPITHGQFALRTRWKLAQQIKKNNYNAAIILTNSWKSALIPWFAGIPVRTGWIGEMRWGLINDIRRLNKKLLPKMVQRYVALGLAAGATVNDFFPPQLYTTQQLAAAALEKFAVSTERPILALCPGAAYGPAKRWPEEYFAQIAQQRLDAGWQIWLFGSQADDSVIEEIRKRINGPTVSFAGKINLHETIDLMSVVSAVVTNDSGLLHIAASLGKPLVAIYGSTSAEFTPPLGKKSQILQEQLACRPCFKRECPLQHMDCMFKIKPQRVLAAIDALATLEEV